MNLRNLDLNLLPVLDALLRRRNVTRAGEEIGLSQSAASHALLRLRHLFGDELLVASGRTLAATPLARQLAGPLRGALDLLTELLDCSHFDPATSAKRFRISTADYVAALILPPLLRHLEKAAPNNSVEVTWGRQVIAADLRSHQLDLVIMPQGSVHGADILSERLFTDELVVIASIDHPDIGKTLDFATYQRLPHAVFRKDGDESAKSFADLQVIRHAINQRESVVVPDFLVLPLVISETRCIALTHRSLAERMRRAAPLRVFKPPFPTEQVEIRCYWSATVDRDPAHAWFRAILKEVCVALFKAERTGTAGRKR
jgi:DNA-binding transcriptional LysR family regulator